MGGDCRGLIAVVRKPTRWLRLLLAGTAVVARMLLSCIMAISRLLGAGHVCTWLPALIHNRNLLKLGLYSSFVTYERRCL